MNSNDSPVHEMNPVQKANNTRFILRSTYLHRGPNITPLTGQSLHVIRGVCSTGRGVLAWCYDQFDAEVGLEMFKATGDYSDLSISRFTQDRDVLIRLIDLAVAFQDVGYSEQVWNLAVKLDEKLFKEGKIAERNDFTSICWPRN